MGDPKTPPTGLSASDILRLFLPDPGPTQIAGILIAISCLWGIFSLFRFWGRMQAERKTVADVTEWTQSDPDAEDLAKLLAELSRPDQRSNTAAKRLAGLAIFTRRQSLVEANESLGAQHDRDIDGRLASPRYIAGLLVFLGLLGTLLGLATTVGSLGPFLNSVQIARVEDLSKLVSNIAGVFHAMRNAFACTMDGVLASLVVGLGLQLCAASYRNSVLVPLDRLCMEKIVPLLSGERALDAVGETLYAAQQALTGFQQALVHYETAAETHKAQAERMAEATDRAAGLLDRSSDSLQSLLDETTGWLSRIEETAAGSAAKLESSHQTIADLLLELRTLTTESLASVQQANTVLERVSAGADGMMQGWVNRADSALERHISEAGAAISRVFERFEAAVAVHVKTSEQAVTAHTNAVTETLVSQLELTAEKFAEQTVVASDIASRAANFSRIAVTENVGQADEHLSRWHETSSQALADVRTSLERIAADTKSMEKQAEQRMSDFGGQALGILSTFQERNEAAMKAIQTDTATSRRQMETIQQSLDQAVRSLTSLIEAADSAFRDASATIMEQVSEQVAEAVRNAAASNTTSGSASGRNNKQ